MSSYCCSSITFHFDWHRNLSFMYSGNDHKFSLKFTTGILYLPGKTLTFTPREGSQVNIKDLLIMQNAPFNFFQLRKNEFNVTISTPVL